MKSNDLINLLRGATFVFLCRLTGAALAFTTQVLLARWMGAEQTGIYVFAFSVCVLLTTAVGLGFPSAAIRIIGQALAHDRADLIRGFARRAIQVPLLLGVVAAGIGCLVVLTVDGLVVVERRAVLFVAFITVPVYGVLHSRTSVAMGLSWFPVAFLPNNVVRPLIFLLLIGTAWYFSYSLSATRAMVLQLVSVAIVLVLQFTVVTRRLRQRFPGADVAFETPQWVRTAASLLLITLFTNYFLELNLFIAGLLLEADQLAVFNASFRTAALIAFGVFAVDAITMPQISRLHAAAETATLQSTVTRAARLRLAGSLIAAVVLFFVGKPVLALFGEGFVDGYTALLILAGAQVISAAFGPTARVLSVTGHQNKCLRVFVVSLVAMALLHPFLIHQLGLSGAAITVVIIVMLQSGWLHALVSRNVGIHASPFALAPGHRAAERR